MNDLPELELLRTFSVLHHERHLTRAGARLGRSQPALSHALGRLRAMFDDPLFVKTQRGMAPTPRADALAPEIEALLVRAEALVRPQRFEPATLARSFVVASADLMELHLAAGILDALRKEAPNVNLEMRIPGADVGDLLATGRLDLLVVPKYAVPANAYSQHLLDDNFLCAVRAGHPIVKKRLTLERYVELDHVQIAPRGLPGGPVDDALAARGLTRRVVLRTSSFLAAPIVVARSDLIITAPSSLLGPLAERLGLHTMPAPLSIDAFHMHQAWHARDHDDPAHRWFRRLVARVGRGS